MYEQFKIVKEEDNILLEWEYHDIDNGWWLQIRYETDSTENIGLIEKEVKCIKGALFIVFKEELQHE